MHSIWSDTISFPKFEQLKKDIQTDVLIIGGGIAGILSAYMLQQSGIDYTLVEANTLCSGITKNTTAKISSQHGLIYHKILKKYGVEKTQMYLDANEIALKRFHELSREFKCGFETKSSYVYSIDNPQKIEKELKALDLIGFQARNVSNLPIPMKTVGAIEFKNQAQFHPLQFLSGIVKGLNIYEHTKVTELGKNVAITEHGKITASKIIVATHFPILNKHGSYFLKMYQHRSYVLALHNAPNVNGMYVDESLTGMSFRNYNNLLLVGGGDHRTGKRGGNWEELAKFADKYYPRSQEQYRWATQDCMTLDDIPYIGQYSKNTPGLYVATGFNKWGMTSSMVAAIILHDLVLGKDNPYAPVFSPSRTMLHPQLATNVLESTINLLTPTTKRCPHLGCALKWNPTEHSWDCPCHGSRFTEHGELIDNPATDDLTHRKM